MLNSSLETIQSNRISEPIDSCIFCLTLVDFEKLNGIFSCHKNREKLQGANGLLCIFDKKECDARNHKHSMKLWAGHHMKKTLWEILSEIPLFIIPTQWQPDFSLRFPCVFHVFSLCFPCVFLVFSTDTRGQH